MATGLLATTQGFFTSTSHKSGSLSELINSPPRHLDARKIFTNDDSDQSESSCPPSPTPLAFSKRPRQSLLPTHSTTSTPSPSKSPKKRARTKSPDYPATREIGVMANTLPPSQDVKNIVNGRMTVLVESLYQRCIPSSTPEANSVVVSNSMPLEMRDFFLAYLHRDPPPPHHPSEWTPPKFKDVHDYCYNLCKEDRSIIPFGRYNGEFMKLRANGRVECWDGDTDSFREEGILTFSHDKGTREHVDVVVLGTIAGTGTGVLLDTSGNVWLYNPANAVDEPILDTKPEQAVVILKTGSHMTKDTEWQIEDVYEQAKIEFVVESDDESDGEE